ncbi:hypothetical protein DL96DRAFT_1816363 [Flagelloscypha sp. PMI_526]|nr:hypothetical protein DL96DRAFT_1816363 [Flagelloscypha sp. PMI_526]
MDSTVNDGDLHNDESLEAYDHNIHQLLCKSQAMKVRRNALLPACSVPPEILTNIFLYVVKEWFSSHEHCREEDLDSCDWRPLILHVCYRWREVAFPCVRLWRYIILDDHKQLVEESMKCCYYEPAALRSFFSPDRSENEVSHSDLLKLTTMIMPNSFKQLESLSLILDSFDVLEVFVYSTSELPQLQVLDLEYIGLAPSMQVLDPFVLAIYLFPGLFDFVELSPHLTSLHIPQALATEHYTIPQSVWASLVQIEHLTLSSAYIRMPTGIQQLDFPRLRSITIDGPDLDELTSFLEDIDFPRSTAIHASHISAYHILPETLSRLCALCKRLAEPGDTGSKSTLDWTYSSGNQVFHFEYLLCRSMNDVGPSSTRLSLGFSARDPSPMSDLLQSLIPRDISYGHVMLSLAGLSRTVNDQIAANLRILSDALAPSPLSQTENSLTVIKQYPCYEDGWPGFLRKRHVWFLIKPRLFCSISFRGTPQHRLVKEFCLVLSEKSLTSFCLRPEGQVVDRPHPHVRFQTTYFDWLAILGLTSIKHLKVESLMEIDSLLEALSSSTISEYGDGPSFPSLDSLTIKNVVFGIGLEEDRGLLGVLKRRKDMGVGLKKLTLEGCYNSRHDVDQLVEQFKSVTEEVDFY